MRRFNSPAHSVTSVPALENRDADSWSLEHPPLRALSPYSSSAGYLPSVCLRHKRYILGTNDRFSPFIICIRLGDDVRL